MIYVNAIKYEKTGCRGKRYVVSLNDTKIIDVVSHNLYGLAKLQSLLFAEIKFDKTASLVEILTAADKSDNECLLEFDKTIQIKQKKVSIKLSFCQELKKVPRSG